MSRTDANAASCHTFANGESFSALCHAPDCPDRACSARDVEIAREAAEDALAEYALFAFGWNAPDDEHTRRSIRNMAERVITAYYDGSLRG